MVMIWILEQFQTGFSELRAGSLAWVSALETGLILKCRHAWQHGAGVLLLSPALGALP